MGPHTHTHTHTHRSHNTADADHRVPRQQHVQVMMAHMESLMLKSPRDNPMLNAAISMCEELIKSGPRKHVLLFNARRQQCPKSLATMPSPPRLREEGSSVCSSLSVCCDQASGAACGRLIARCVWLPQQAAIFDLRFRLAPQMFENVEHFRSGGRSKTCDRFL